MSKPVEHSLSELCTRCSAIANRTARVSIKLEKLPTSTSPSWDERIKELKSTVSDFVLQMDLVVLVFQATSDIEESSQRQLEVLVSGAETLETLTSAAVLDRDHGQSMQPSSAELEQLVQTQKTWSRLLQLLLSLYDYIRLSGDEGASEMFEVTAADLDELQQLIQRLQSPGSPLPTSTSTGFPDTQTSPPAYGEAFPASQSFPREKKSPRSQRHSDDEPKKAPPQIATSSSSIGIRRKSSTPSPSGKPKLGAFKGFFRSISTSLSPVPPLVTPLCQAAAAGNIDQVRGLIKQGANINSCNEEGYTPLTAAIHGEGHNNHLKTVRFLIGCGAKVTARDAVWSLPPLWHAARAGRIDIINFLLDCDADPEECTASGSSYLYSCMEKISVPVLELLLKRGADPNAANFSGKTALVGCVQRRDIAKARALLEAGAKVTGMGGAGHSALAVAVSNKDVAMAELLVSNGAKPQSSDGHGRALVVVAVNNDDATMLRLLLDKRAPADGKDVHGNTALIRAVQKEDPAMTEMLLAYGADASTQDDTGTPALALAVTQSRIEQARMLVQHWADVTVSMSRSTSTHILVAAMQVRATSEDQIAFIHFLLRHRANPNRMPDSHDPEMVSSLPLGYCIKNNRHDIMKVLLDAGADPHRSGQNRTRALSDPLASTTPFRYAASSGNHGSLKVLLKDYGAVSKLRGTKVNVDKVLLKAAEASQSEAVITLLLDEGLEHFEVSTKMALENSDNEVIRRVMTMRALEQQTRQGGAGRPEGLPPAYQEIKR